MQPTATLSSGPSTRSKTRAGLRLVIATLAVVGLAGPLAACSSSDSTAAAADAVAAGTPLIDVRTPEEFAGGHLEGAVNMDVQSAAFASELASLDPSADYLVYCRSGNRSGQAIEQMRAAGFTGELTNLGSVAEASSATGLAVVR